MRPLVLLLSLTAALGAQTPATAKLDPAMAASQAKAGAELAWHDPAGWGLEGRLWPEQERRSFFDRLPAAAEKSVPAAVWSLSRDSAGLMVRFRTDAKSIHVHYKVTKAALAMPHMPATGVSGVDLYARDAQGRWRWVNVARPAQAEVRTELIGGLDGAAREYALYLPLYNGVQALEIGVPKGAAFAGLAPRPKPIVFYGTSITHGACASRPGMVHTAILGRRFDAPVANLGFSGNGRMDASVGAFLAQVDAAAFVIDCLPNMGPEQVAERCVPLVKQLRAAQPDTPIVLVEDRRNTNEWLQPTRRAHHDRNHAALRVAFAELREQGVKKLFYIPGDALYGTDGDGATDGSHASDLGFFRQADVFEPILREALGR